MESEFKQLDKIIGALLGTQGTHLTAPAAIARAAGRPYDDARVNLFQTLAIELQENSLHVPTADPHIDSNLQAFIETYFSNYIEGTEFEIEEAHEIVVQGRPLKYREDDSHDILGTYRAILESKAKPIIPQRFEDFARQLQQWNREVIESRQSKSPGEFKTESNRAGNTVCVIADLVVGTLEKGYELIMSAATRRRALKTAETISNSALRAVNATVNQAAKDVGIRFHRHWRVPTASVIARVFADGGHAKAVEDLNMWTTSDGARLAPCPIIVEARKGWNSVDALLIPQV